MSERARKATSSLDQPSTTGALALTVGIVVACVLVFFLVDNLSHTLPQSQTLWETLKGLDLALIPAVIVSFVVTSRMVQDTSSRIADVVERDVVGTLTHQINDLIPGREVYGLVRIHPSMPYGDLFSQLGAGDELLWLDTYWPTIPEFRRNIDEALSRGAKMRMLVIDPTSDNAGYRADEITDRVIATNFRVEAAAFAQSVVVLLGGVDTGKDTEIRVYHDLPCAPMYVVLRNGKLLKGYSSLFLTKPTGIGFPHFEWMPVTNPGGTKGFLEEIHAYFEQKWTTQESSPRGGGTIFPIA